MKDTFEKEKQRNVESPKRPYSNSLKIPKYILK